MTLCSAASVFETKLWLGCDWPSASEIASAAHCKAEMGKYAGSVEEYCGRAASVAGLSSHGRLEWITFMFSFALRSRRAEHQLGGARWESLP